MFHVENIYIQIVGARLSVAGLYGCPICGQGLTPTELESHYSSELDYLTKLSMSLVTGANIIKQRISISPGMDQAPRNRWDVSISSPTLSIAIV